MTNPKPLIIWSIIATGISSVTTQLITIREFLSQFHGNEITISLVLFSWLLLTGLGSLAAKGIRRPSLGLYTLLLFIIAMAPLVQLLLIRGFRDILFAHGASPGFYPIFFYILITIFPYCLLTGFILPYALRVIQDEHQAFTSGDLYLTDSAGDICGGMIFSFALVYWLNPFPTVAVASAMLIWVGFQLLARRRRFGLLAGTLVFAAVFYFFSTNALFEIKTLKGQYGDVVRYVESPYGRIVVSREGPQHTVWESGTPIYSGSNVIGSEEKVHYALCQLDRVESVLLVSGGLGDTTTEIAKYKPSSIDYVELDPTLTRVALKEGIIRKVPRLRIIHADGRRHLKVTHKQYDAILVDIPDPDTFQLNRFFTSEFFSLARSRLTKGGILSVSMEYSPNYISDIKRKKLSSLYNTAKMHFENVVVLPGEEAYFLCRDGEIALDIPSRLDRKSISTSYIEGYFSGNVTDERIRQLNEAIDRGEYINTDLEPRLMNVVFREWFMKHGTSPRYFVIVLAALTAVYLVFIRREEYVLFSTGLVTMGVEMLIIFSFQVIYGYIYLKIGAIVTAFLVGLLPGAVLGNLSVGKGTGRLIVSELLILAMLLLFFLWVVYLKIELPPFIFLAYCLVFSFFCGYQFPVAAGKIGEKHSPAAGCLAADLCGASVGTLATGTLLIPLLGIQAAIIFLILVKISSSMIIMRRR